MVGDKKIFFVKPVKQWKMPSWERNNSEHDIIQHTQMLFFNMLNFLVSSCMRDNLSEPYIAIGSTNVL